MSKSDPFGFDMSVSSAKKKNPRGRRGMSGASETSTRICDHDGCEEAGKFRAPKAPDVLDEFFWFCQQHVRDYNLKWNFFDGTTEAEINAQQSKDKVWERATKPMTDPEARAWARLGIEDPHQVLGKNATQNPGRGGSAAARKLPPTEKRAQILQGADQGAAPGYERRRSQPRRSVARGRLGLGSDQRQPEFQITKTLDRARAWARFSRKLRKVTAK